MIETGSTVTYLGHEATVIHVFTTTANIRFNKPVPGLSRQQDVMLTSLRLADCGCWNYQHLDRCIHTV